jgi:dTMP kinase
MYTGELIVFEGIDGSGKTTQSKRLRQHFMQQGLACDWFREPGESRAGRRIRELAMNDQHLTPEEELALFIEDRLENIQTNILSNLALGHRVILDRYYFSSVCYQGARGLDPQDILNRHSFAPRPDLAFYIDVGVKAALERIRRNRSERAVRFEVEDYLEKVRLHYLRLCDQGFLIRVEGEGAEEEIFSEITRICGDRLRSHR